MASSPAAAAALAADYDGDDDDAGGDYDGCCRGGGQRQTDDRYLMKPSQGTPCKCNVRSHLQSRVTAAKDTVAPERSLRC